jgi:flagellin
MTINNNPNYMNVQGTAQSGSSTLEKIATGLLINKAADDASGLAIADQLRAQSSSLSQSIDNVSSGIAMSNIAQSGLSSQQELLENIKTETLKASTATTSEEGRQAIADQINKYIDQFERIADETTYNGESLLKTDGSTSDDISIVADGSTIEMEKSDTLSISDQLRSYMDDFVTNGDSRDQLLDTLDQSISDISSFAADFGSASNSLESMAKNYMTAQTNIENAQSQVRDADLEEMFSKFKREDIQSQIGMFVQTQANAVQSRVLPLIS